MINQFDSKQALKNQAEIAVDGVTASIGFTVNFVEQGDGSALDANESYIAEKYMPTPVVAFGVGDNSSDYHNSLYQLTVYSPKSSGVNMNMLIAEKIKPYFARGTVLTKSSQSLRIKQTSQTQVTSDDTHHLTFLTINYFATN